MNTKAAATVCAVLLLIPMIQVPASGADFTDVSPESAYYEEISALAEEGIIFGNSSGQYRAQDPITVSQWAAMLCRAFGDADDGDYLLQCHQNRWFSEIAMTSTQTKVCRGSMLLSAFRAAEIPVYDGSLYNGGAKCSDRENALRVGKELGLCGEDATATDIMTRGEAAELIYRLLHNTYQVTEPSIAGKLQVENPDKAELNAYYLKLNQLPDTLLKEFREDHWTFQVNSDYIQAYSADYGINCSGLTYYTEKTIYVSESSAVIHEFGHFLEAQLQFPQRFESLYQKESKAAKAVLGTYSTTNSREYIAEYFNYWLTNHTSQTKMARLQKVSPETYAYFAKLEANGWRS